MKIFEIIPTLQTGGAEKLVVDLTNEMAKLNNQCTIVALFKLNSDDILASYLNNNVHIHTLYKRLGFDVKCLWRLYMYICKERPDIVHGHVGAITYLILPALLYRKCKYFATIHSEAKREAGFGVSKYIRRFLFKNKIVNPITISEESNKSFKEYYNINSNMILNGCSHYLGSDKIDESFYRKDVDLLFVHVGRLQEIKNQETLVKAFDRLLNDGIKARLLIIGRKENENIYKAISPYFSDYIMYLGEQYDCRAYMNIADAFCLTSYMEGLPITLIEALSVGCIPIVTPVGGCVNVIEDGVNGFLANDSSEDSVYMAIKRFSLLDEGLRNIMSIKAKESFLKDYSIEKSAKEHINLFNEK